MPAAVGDHPIETPVRRTLLKIGTTTATEAHTEPSCFPAGAMTGQLPTAVDGRNARMGECLINGGSDDQGDV